MRRHLLAFLALLLLVGATSCYRSGRTDPVRAAQLHMSHVATQMHLAVYDAQRQTALSVDMLQQIVDRIDTEMAAAGGATCPLDGGQVLFCPDVELWVWATTAEQDHPKVLMVSERPISVKGRDKYVVVDSLFEPRLIDEGERPAWVERALRAK